MTRVAGAARTVAWVADEAWHRVAVSLTGSLSLLGWRSRDRAPGVVLREGEICIEPSADPASDPLLLLRVSAIAAEKRARLARGHPRPAGRPGEATARAPGRWRRVSCSWICCVAAITRYPSSRRWIRVVCGAGCCPSGSRSAVAPQRNAYHRFTVDRHLCETAANAAALTDRVDRPDLLVVGALLHDLGKGRGGDHTEVGIELIAYRRTAPRLPAGRRRCAR